MLIQVNPYICFLGVKLNDLAETKAFLSVLNSLKMQCSVNTPEIYRALVFTLKDFVGSPNMDSVFKKVFLKYIIF